MNLRSSSCACTVSILALFIRRVTHIDIVASTRHASNVKSLPIAKRHLGTIRPLRLRETSHHIGNAAPDHRDSTEFHQARSQGKSSTLELSTRTTQSSPFDNLGSAQWAADDLEEKRKVPAREHLSPTVTYESAGTDIECSASSLAETPDDTHEEGAAFLELNTETIDVLAAESLSGSSSHMKQHSARRIWEARPRRPQAAKEGFRLHYSSSLLTPTPKGREAKPRTRSFSEHQVPASGVSGDYRYSNAEREPWQTQKAALKEKFKEGWNPRKKLSPDALAGIRAIHAQFPEQYTTSVLAQKFEVSPEAIRRILKSRWTPDEEEALDRQRRWFLRGQKVWSRYAELGVKPPARWRELGIGTKGKYARRRERMSLKWNITVRNINHVGALSAAPPSMAERIL